MRPSTFGTEEEEEIRYQAAFSLNFISSISPDRYIDCDLEQRNVLHFSFPNTTISAEMKRLLLTGTDCRVGKDEGDGESYTIEAVFSAILVGD